MGGDDVGETTCKWGLLAPRCCRPFANMKVVLLVLSCLIALQVISSDYQYMYSKYAHLVAAWLGTLCGTHVRVFCTEKPCLQGMIVNGLLNVSITSIEKRFDIESADAGLIASCYDIAAVICLIPVGYFGGHGSKPRWLGFGALIMGVGAFVFALPHFTTGLYELV